MSDWKTKCLYFEGKDRKLDKGYRDYQKARLWAGEAWEKVLDDAGVEILIRLWGKQKLTPKRMTFHEVERLLAWFHVCSTICAIKMKSISLILYPTEIQTLWFRNLHGG